jgi:hypothetical protein
MPVSSGRVALNGRSRLVEAGGGGCRRDGGVVFTGM